MFIVGDSLVVPAMLVDPGVNWQRDGEVGPLCGSVTLVERYANSRPKKNYAPYTAAMGRPTVSGYGRLKESV